MPDQRTGFQDPLPQAAEATKGFFGDLFSGLFGSLKFGAETIAQTAKPETFRQAFDLGEFRGQPRQDAAPGFKWAKTGGSVIGPGNVPMPEWRQVPVENFPQPPVAENIPGIAGQVLGNIVFPASIPPITAEDLQRDPLLGIAIAAPPGAIATGGLAGLGRDVREIKNISRTLQADQRGLAGARRGLQGRRAPAPTVTIASRTIRVTRRGTTDEFASLERRVPIVNNEYRVRPSIDQFGHKDVFVVERDAIADAATTTAELNAAFVKGGFRTQKEAVEFAKTLPVTPAGTARGVPPPPTPRTIEGEARRKLRQFEGGFDEGFFTPEFAADDLAEFNIRRAQIERLERGRTGAGFTPEDLIAQDKLIDTSVRELEQISARMELRQVNLPKFQELQAEAASTPLAATNVPPPSVPPVSEPPIAIPPSGRPRTLLDLNREARGMRAMTPEQRAAVMDSAKPIESTDLLYRVQPFESHGQRLLGPDKAINKHLRSVPGLKQAAGLVNRSQMVRNDPVAMIGINKAIFQEVEKSQARFAGLRWWHDAQGAFGFRRRQGIWKATKVQSSTIVKADFQRFGLLDDMMDHPERYDLNIEQARILRMGQDMQTQLLRDAQRLGVDAVELADNYWHRIVLKGPKELKSGSFFRKDFNVRSSKKGWTYQRAFQDADIGAARGFTYETNPMNRLVARLEAGIDVIADQQARKAITRLPGVERPLERLESRFPNVIVASKEAREARDAAKAVYLADQTPTNFQVLRQTEADFISAQRELFLKKTAVAQPGHHELRLPNGRIAPQELVDQIRKSIDLPEIARSGGAVGNTVRESTQLVRSVLTNVDLAAGYIQGQSLFYRNNPAWWKSQGRAILSMIDDPHAWVAKNFDVIQEGVNVGAISTPTEFMFARTGLASIPTRIPVIGPGMRAFNRAFEWFTLVGQTELYKSARTGLTGMDELVSLGSAIRKGLGTESFAILGIRPNQQAAESLMFFAARFMRANTGILAQSLTTGPGGAEARRLVGSLLAGGTSLLIGVSWMKNGKLPNLGDPFAPDWMQVSFGKTNFNPFGPFYPYFRTIARMSVRLAEGEPTKAANELKRFLASKEGIPFRALDMAGQFAFLGEARGFEGDVIEKTPTGIARGLVEEFGIPIAPGEIVRGFREGRPEVLTEVVGLMGRASPFSQMDILFQEQLDINPEGKSYTKAEPRQRDEMERRYPEIAERLRETGRGPFGEAERQWYETDTKYYNQEAALEARFQRGAINGKQFRDRQSSIQSERAVEKQATNRAFGLFQEERPLPDDPNERAMAQYYQALEGARREDGTYDWDKAESAIAGLESTKWTEGQRDYVDRNTNRTVHTPLVSELREWRSRLDFQPYWEAHKLLLLHPKVNRPDLVQDYERYRDANILVKIQMDKATEDRPKDFFKQITNAVSQIHTTQRGRNAELDAFLIRYGYVEKPKNAHALLLIREILDTNMLLTDVFQEDSLDMSNNKS